MVREMSSPQRRHRMHRAVCKVGREIQRDHRANYGRSRAQSGALKQPHPAGADPSGSADRHRVEEEAGQEGQ